MSSLKEKVAADLKDAMRAKNDVRRRTLRSLRAALMEKEIEQRQGGTSTLSEQDELSVARKQAKQRRDAVQQYEEAGREDLAEKERAELAVLEEYLPQQLSEADMRKEVHNVVQEVGATSPRDMGPVMQEAMRRLRGRADGRRVQQLAQQILSELGEG